VFQKVFNSTQAPRTWQDLAAYAARLHGMDLNGDNTTDYGICLERRLGGYTIFCNQSDWAPDVVPRSDDRGEANPEG
jgi:hypothetical protein